MYPIACVPGYFGQVRVLSFNHGTFETETGTPAKRPGIPSGSVCCRSSTESALFSIPYSSEFGALESGSQPYSTGSRAARRLCVRDWFRCYINLLMPAEFRVVYCLQFKCAAHARGLGFGYYNPTQA